MAPAPSARDPAGRGDRPRGAGGDRHRRRLAPRPDHARRPRQRLGGSRRDARRTLRALGAVRDLAAGPGRGARRTGPEAGPRAARRTGRHHALALGQGQRRRAAPDPSEGAGARRFPCRHENGGQRNRAAPGRVARRKGDGTGARHPGVVRDALARAAEGIDRRRRARRADRAADPADRPAAGLPLAGRGGDPARLRRDHGARLTRGPLFPHRLVLDRRLRADRLHDDRARLGGRLRAADGVALPRGAGGRGRADRGGAKNQAPRRPDRRLRRVDAAALDARLAADPARLAAGQPRRDGGDGRRPQRHRRHRGRPGDPHPGRRRGEPLADRQAPERRALGGDALRQRGAAAPAVGLKLGPPSPEQLAKDAPARVNAELIDKAIGPGWDAPFQIVATNPNGPITDAGTMAALEHFQHKVAHLPGVKVVIGPQAATKRVEPLQELGNSVLASRGNIGPVKELAKLGKELNVAAGGVAALREGIAEASSGAGLLALGSEHATEGASLIASGLARAAGGSGRAIDALERFAKGSEKLTEGLLQAEIGAIQLRVTGINSITNVLNYNGRRIQREQLRQLRAEQNETLPHLLAPTVASVEKLQAAEAKLKEAAPTDPAAAQALESVQAALAAISGTDPVTGQPYAEGYAGVVAELEGLRERLGEDAELNQETTAYIHSTVEGLKKAGRAAGRLIEGLQKLHKGANTLTHGADKLAKEAGRLGSGIEKLSGGATQLVSGLGKLSGGAEALEENLAAGVSKVEPLQTGLTEASVKVLEGHARIRKEAGEVQDQTPGLFNSGYFVLSALDGAPPGAREKAAQTIDLNKGGQAASMLVISKYEFNSPGSIELNKKLAAAADELGENASLETGVAGGAAQLNDYSHITRERIPWIIAIITLVTFLVLVVVLRALPLAAIAVGLNLLTVGVAFGILTLLFHVPEDWPLGGHNYVDAVGACMIFAVVFGLSIDYAVFLLSRMRERYEAGDDNATAVRFGLEKTARVITGAAVIMLAVFVVFAGAPIATVSQLGIGLTIAVVLDATVVRIVLLPALMLLLGDRVWWLPAPLKRVLPKLNV